MEKKIKIPLVDNSKNRQELINRVENTVLSILQQISQRKLPKLSYSELKLDDIELTKSNDPEVDDDDEDDDIRSIPTTFSYSTQRQYAVELPSTSKIEDNSIELYRKKTSRDRILDFSNKSDRIKMTRMLTVMGQAYKHLLRESVQTKRSFYYELKGGDASILFERQETVDKSICNVANLLKCPTWELGFIATSKGLVAGKCTLTFENGDVMNCNSPDGVLIPQISTNSDRQIIEINYSAKCIIIVEKESVFQKLLHDDCPRTLGIILITGKGYPDVATRTFVKILVDKIKIPVYVLVDANPHGFEIMCVYKYGSMNLWWENENLICPMIRWIGFYPSELIGLHLPRIPLTDNDKRKLDSLEKRLYISEIERKELKMMREGKAEIESLAGISPYFLTSRYLSMKIQN